ncbi:ABC transporter permease [Mobiluncus mulieris]|uniref:ABC transporter permease n=1 Tax=Mobiluncus mulieris TaxID=2052 RepID=UPI000DFBAAE5|nr:ABC transporter permease [Mobiluncus mulieris]STY84355.1 ABC-2 family transporter protein [Mobiluncus mulieris]
MNTTPNYFEWFLRELLRWSKSTALLVVTLVGAFMIFTSIMGTVSNRAPELEQGLIDEKTFSDIVLSMSFAGSMFTAILGIVIVTGDFTTKFSTRLFLFNRLPFALMVVKAMVAAILGLVSGAIILVTSWFSTQGVLAARGYEFFPPDNPWQWAGGYLVMFTLTAIWGVALGFIFRNTVVGIVFHVFYLMTIERTVKDIFPEMKKWLPGGAQSAIVNDYTMPGHLGFWSGVGVYSLWILGLFVITALLLMKFNRPLVPSLTEIITKRFSFTKKPATNTQTPEVTAKPQPITR